MSIKITFVRHGQTSKNHAALIQTGMHEELTEIGFEQAKMLGKHLKNESFTKVYSSDMTRAVQTAETIVGQWDQKPKIISTAQLRERNYGEWDGKPIKELLNLAAELKVHPVVVTPPGGETYEEAFLRFINFLIELLIENNEENIISNSPPHYLLISHSALIHGFLHKLVTNQETGLKVKDLDSENALKPPPNTGFTTFIIKKSSDQFVFKFDKLFCTDHLQHNNENGLYTY